ncbi:hypothetical protein [Chryseobacterium indologenes]|uniref:hypothetical protein n=1 Tax=Chryseobacterium indologenes TaxID=253 RepID=UPI0016283464|nr:hypothetical protein [Chryseobacterium indologenes]
MMKPFRIESKLLLFIVLAPIIFYSIYTVFIFRNDIIDDAYITLTYARNLFEYGKPHYLVVDDYQGNGQTSILWMLINTPLFAFKEIDHVLYIKFVNLILSIIVVFDFFKSLRKINVKDYLVYVPVLAVFFFWLSLNISHGLETILFFFVLYFYLKEQRKGNGKWISLLLPLIRPEGLVFVGLQVFNYNSLKDFLTRTCVFISSILIFLSYQYLFFDQLIPLPFLLKSQLIISDFKVSKFLQLFCFFTPVILFYFSNRRNIIYVAPLVFFIIYYSFCVDEVMNIFQRYSFPLFAFYLVYLKNDYDDKSNNLILWMYIPLVFYLKNLNNDRINYKYSYNKGMQSGAIPLGKYLYNDSSNTNDVVVTSDAGAIAFFSKKQCIDTWGLNNAQLLKYSKNNEWNKYLQYIDLKSPKYIILISNEKNVFKSNLDFEKRIYTHYKLDKIKINSVWMSNDNYYYFLYKLN